MKRGRPRAIRRRKGLKAAVRLRFSPKQRAAAKGRANTRRRKGR